MSDLLEEMQNADLPSLIKEAMAETFGKCPNCSTSVQVGFWLRWCPKKACRYVAPRGKMQNA